MMRKKYTKILIVIMFIGIFQGFQHTSQGSVWRTLNRMKSKYYFEGELQIHLAQAIETDDERRMSELLGNGADINAIGREEMRPLFWGVGTVAGAVVAVGDHLAG